MRSIIIAAVAAVAFVSLGNPSHALPPICHPGDPCCGRCRSVHGHHALPTAHRHPHHRTHPTG
jgi:hypothetical protein